ncbi:MAG: SDR family NAD(P)-dependent oxidoreductase [Lachnospiraceae bacterium]|nr:SDR family NAD(P)-dependent oxidoreductase [Lachnospiraceae bacterium]
MQERKVVLITGGAMGQGRAHALKYAENGFDVVLADMLDPEDERFAETVSLVEAFGAKALAVKANICKTEDMEALFAKAWETFGRLDVVIANAGVINFGYTWELTDEQVEKVINIDLIGTWRTDKYATQYMLKQGFGRIINISSTSGLYGTPKLATYCMAKWGVLGLTKTLAKEVKNKGITVNALCPTKVKTPMCETPAYVEFINELTGKNFKDYHEMYEGVPFLEVSDIAEMVYWLGTSPVADKFTGREVPLDLGTLQ